jgi:general secretion pathway protein C
MEAYIRQYFWVVGALVVALCAVFTAKGVNHFVEARYLPDRKESRPMPRVSAAAPAKAARSKVGTALVDRNMFCSDCLPPAPAETPGGPVVESNAPPETSLPLRLVATNVSTVEDSSFATVQNTSSNRQGAYWTGDEIPEAGEIVRIRGKYVDFKNTKARRVERISLLAAAPAAKAPVTAAATRSRPSTRGNSARDELMAAIDSGVRKTGENSWEIDRSVVDKVLANPAAVGRGARIVPSIKNGKPNGFKLYAIRPSSVYSKIGLMNGDTLHAVNGFELSTPDKALEVYTKVREASSLQVTVTRRGKPVDLSYSIK